jgi:hypothetical protein
VGCCSSRVSFYRAEDGRGGGAMRGTAGGGVRHYWPSNLQFWEGKGGVSGE